MNTFAADDAQAPSVAPRPAAPPPPLSRLEWALLACAYLSQFVAFGFFFMALTVILRGRGVALEELGWLYALAAVPGLKFLWAPLFDRYGLGRHGHYGKQLALMQALLMAALLWLASLPMQADAPLPLGALMAGCTLVALLSACQDIAADGLSCRLLGPAQLGMGNAVQMAGGILGFAAGGGGVLALYQHMGWRIALLSLVALSAVPLVLALLYREPPHARPAAHATAHAQRPPLRDYWRQLVRFWRQPGNGWAWAGFIVLAQAGVSMAYGVLNPMLVDEGWSESEIGLLINLYGGLASVLTALGLGWLLRRQSPQAALRWMLPAQALAVLALAAPLLLTDNRAWITAGGVIYLALYIPLGVLLSALMMGRASAHAPASDFSMQHGIYTNAGMAASALALPIAAQWGYPALMALALVVSLATCLVAPGLWRRAEAARNA